MFMNTTGPQEILAVFEKTGALLSGHFILSSGRHSEQYLQCARALQYPEEAGGLGRALAAKFRDEKIDAVISPALGGLIIGYETARALRVRAMWTERRAGVHSLRRGFEVEPEERILIIEDVVTTGASSSEVAEVVKRQGARIAGFGALADRSVGQFKPAERFEALIKLNIPVFRAEDCPLCQENIPLVKPGSR